ncbi:hypothetical protein N7488_001584 [Penicillium malachiteum]|nr:hypothetical protein N7488_001584 [Penicillium malachiteum]
MSSLCKDLAQISIQDVFSLGDLPVEIVITISDFCDTSSLVNLARSSKGFYKILESEKNYRARKGFLYPPEERYKYERLEKQFLQDNPWSNQPMPWMYKRASGISHNDTGYLCRVIETGKVDGLKFLLDLGADPNCCTIHGTTLLIHAVQENQPKIVQLLLERGADVTYISWDIPPPGQIIYQFNAFYWAQYLPDEEIVQLLLRTGQVQIIRQEDLQKFLLNRPLETLRVLFENLTPALLFGKKSYADWTLSLLHELMDRKKSRGEAMSLALSFNLPKEIINARCIDGHTIIEKVLERKDLWSTLIPTLITCGHDLSDTFNACVYGPLPGYRGLTQFLGATPLHVMIRFREWDLANQLIKAGCRLNVIATCERTRWSELYMAVKSNAPMDVISSLLTAGADVNCVHDLGSCRMLLEHPDRLLFQTPLSWAIQYNSKDMVRAMLTLGIVRPDLTIKNWRDETPMEYARLRGNVEIIRMLEEELESQNRT